MTLYNVRGPEDAVRFVQLVRDPWSIVGIEFAWAYLLIYINGHDRHTISGPELVITTILTVLSVYDKAFPAAVNRFLVSDQSLVIAGIGVT